MLMPEKATAEQTLQDINKKYEDEFVKIQEEFTKKYKEYMALGDTIPETIRARRMQEVQDSQSRIEFPGNGIWGYSKTTRSSFRSYSTEVDGCH